MATKKKIDYERAADKPSQKATRAAVIEDFENVDYISISDAQANFTRGGDTVLQLLAAEEMTGKIDPATGRSNPMMRRSWKIKVLCDHWGLEVKPGDVIEWKANKHRHDKSGRKYTSRDVAEMKRRGEGNKLVDMHAAVVDNKCCIELGFQDASKLLATHGVYYLSGMPLSKLKQFSRAEKMAPDGVMRKVHNWRYVEVLPDEYEKLPVFSAETTATRGRPRKIIEE